MVKKNYSKPNLKVIPIDMQENLLQDSNEVGFDGGGDRDSDVKGHRRGFSWDDEDEEY